MARPFTNCSMDIFIRAAVGKEYIRAAVGKGSGHARLDSGEYRNGDDQERRGTSIYNIGMIIMMM